jgi:hypothetical protein
MKIKKNAFSTLVLELFFPSIANCKKLKIQKIPKVDFPYPKVPYQRVHDDGEPGREAGYGRVDDMLTSQRAT